MFYLLHKVNNIDVLQPVSTTTFVSKWRISLIVLKVYSPKDEFHKDPLVTALLGIHPPYFKQNDGSNLCTTLLFFLLFFRINSTLLNSSHRYNSKNNSIMYSACCCVIHLHSIPILSSHMLRIFFFYHSIKRL
jgi:hypothetical protein